VTSGIGVELISPGGKVYASNGSIIDPVTPLRLGVVTGGQPVPAASRGRLLTIAGNSIQEFGLTSYSTVKTSAFTGGTAVDATLAGDTIAIATTTGTIVLVPLT
jgi:hypothetical protein